MSCRSPGLHTSSSLWDPSPRPSPSPRSACDGDGDGDGDGESDPEDADEVKLAGEAVDILCNADRIPLLKAQAGIPRPYPIWLPLIELCYSDNQGAWRCK